MYKILEARSTHALEELVAEYLMKGWRLGGGIVPVVDIAGFDDRPKSAIAKVDTRVSYMQSVYHPDVIEEAIINQQKDEEILPEVDLSLEEVQVESETLRIPGCDCAGHCKNYEIRPSPGPSGSMSPWCLTNNKWVTL